MIPFEDAYAIIQDEVRALPTEIKPLESATGQVLAQALKAKDALPRFNNSAVDGYAVHADDVLGASESSPIELPVVDTIAAGSPALRRIAPGEAAMILTGAPMPPGADAIVMKEVTHRRNGAVLIHKGVSKAENLRLRGEEYAAGTPILEAGTLITPPVAGLIAALGYGRIRVYRKPSVAIIVTGSELQAPGSPLAAGQIWESNSYSLRAALGTMGIEPDIIRVSDDEALSTQAVTAALKQHDAVISSGGISVGEYDYLRTAFASAGVEEHFWRIAMKPGKPVYFGTRGKALVFGLPGNPVSLMVAFYALVRPALLAMQGSRLAPERTVRARLGTALAKKAGRMEFVRMQLSAGESGYQALPAKGQESHMLGGLAFADGLYRFPSDQTTKRKGSIIEVELLQWSAL